MVNRLHRSCLICALAVPGCDQSNEFVAPPPPDVTVQAPQQKTVTTWTQFTGRTAAIETVEVRARVQGFLDTMDFEPSQVVEKGQLLFTIEKEPFVAAVDVAKAEVAQRVAALQLAEVTLQKAQAAFDKGAVTELEMAEKSAQRDAAEAQKKATEATLEQREIDLSYTEIVAPIAGRISRDLVSVGNLVGAGESTLLTTIVQDEPIHVYVTISERALLKYLEKRPADTDDKDKKPLRLQLTDGRIYEHEGVVDFSDNTIDPATGTLSIRAVFPNPDGQLYPGLFVRALAPNEAAEALLVPDAALQRDISGFYLLVVNESGVVERRDVETGAMDGSNRIITAGIEPSDRVIVNGLQRARPGISVTAVQAESTDRPTTDGSPSSEAAREDA